MFLSFIVHPLVIHHSFSLLPRSLSHRSRSSFRRRPFVLFWFTVRSPVVRRSFSRRSRSSSRLSCSSIGAELRVFVCEFLTQPARPCIAVTTAGGQTGPVAMVTGLVVMATARARQPECLENQLLLPGGWCLELEVSGISSGIVGVWDIVSDGIVPSVWILSRAG